MLVAKRVRQVRFEAPQPLLLCTYTNVAVDNLVDGLVKAGVKPLRVGYHGTIRSSLIPYSLDYKLQQHPLTATVQKLVDESASTQEGIEELNGKYKDLEKKVEDAAARTPRRETVQRLTNMRDALVKLKTRAKYLKSRIFSIQQKMLTDIVSDADVVCFFAWYFALFFFADDCGSRSARLASHPLAMRLILWISL